LDYFSDPQNHSTQQKMWLLGAGILTVLHDNANTVKMTRK